MALNANAQNIMRVLLLVNKYIAARETKRKKTLLMENCEYPLKEGQEQRLTTLLKVLDTLKGNLNLDKILNRHIEPSGRYRAARETALLLAIKTGNYDAAHMLLEKASEWGILQQTLDATSLGKNADQLAQQSKDPRFLKLINDYRAKLSLSEACSNTMQ